MTKQSVSHIQLVDLIDGSTQNTNKNIKDFVMKEVTGLLEQSALLEVVYGTFTGVYSSCVSWFRYVVVLTLIISFFLMA